MPDVKGLLNDPKFQELDESQQRKVLGQVDPEFANLSDTDFAEFKQRMYTSDLTQPDESNPVIKGLKSFGENIAGMVTHPESLLSSLPGPAQFKQSMDAINWIRDPNRNVEGLVNQIPVVGPASTQLYHDIKDKGYAEALGHGAADLLPFALGEGGETVAPKVVPFVKGAYNSIKSPEVYRPMVTGHILGAAVGEIPKLFGMEGSYGIGSSLGTAAALIPTIPKIIRGGMEEVKGIPDAREAMAMQMKYPKAGGISSADFIPPTRAPESNITGFEGYPEKIPSDARFSPEQIAEYQKTLPKVKVDRPIKNNTGVDPSYAKPNLVKVRKPSDSISKPDPNEPERTGSVVKDDKVKSTEKPEGLTDKEWQGIVNRRTNASNMAERMVDFAKQEGLSSEDISKFDNNSWRDFVDRMRVDQIKKGEKVPVREYRGTLESSQSHPKLIQLLKEYESKNKGVTVKSVKEGEQAPPFKFPEAKKLTDDESIEPPKGMTRLFRAEHPNATKQTFDIMFPGEKPDNSVGGWYTTEFKLANMYKDLANHQHGPGAEVKYIDVPSDIAESYRASKQFPKGEGSKERAESEYFVPQLRRLLLSQ